MTDIPRFWLFTLARDHGMTLHTERCVRRRRKSTRWTGPLTMQQIMRLPSETYFVCQACLSGKFTLSRPAATRKAARSIAGPSHNHDRR